MLHVASFDKLRYLKDMDSEERRKMGHVDQNKIKLFGKEIVEVQMREVYQKT